MNLNLLQLDPVTHHLDLVIGATKMVKSARRILIRYVSGEIPSLSIDYWKARARSTWITVGI
jgi:hypothetical protein